MKVMVWGGDTWGMSMLKKKNGKAQWQPWHVFLPRPVHSPKYNNTNTNTQQQRQHVQHERTLCEIYQPPFDRAPRTHLFNNQFNLSKGGGCSDISLRGGVS